MFRIGDFAHLGGVSAKMLRAWDEAGLFRPVWVDPVTRYRLYSPAQLPDLRRLVALRDLGVPLADLVELVSGGSDLRSVLERRRCELEAARVEIDRRLAALDISVAGAGYGAAADGAGLDVVIRPIAEETVAALEVVDGDENAAFYALEATVLALGRRASRPPGTLVRRRTADRRRITEAYVPVTGGPPTAGGVDDRIRWGELPAARAATLLHRGSYDGLRRARRALDRWIARAGLRVTGDSRVVYLQFGAEPELRVPRSFLVGHERDFVTEIQVELAP